LFCHLTKRIKLGIFIFIERIYLLMKPITRKQFLLSLVAGASAMAISACEQKKSSNQNPTATRISENNSDSPETPQSANQELAPTPTREEQTTSPKSTSPHQDPTETQVETVTVLPNPSATLPASAITPAGSPDLVVARGGDDPEVLVRRAIAALGGIEQFITKGAKVVIKPNICTAYLPYEYASTTNPWVVSALVKIALEAGAGDVTVMDNPFGGSAEDAYVISGIQEQVEAAGGKMAVMSRLKFIETQIPKGIKIKKWPIYEDVKKADVLINVPIAKNHGLSKLTLGMKNLMGVVQNREYLHSDIGQTLADLTSQVYPTLTIVDAIRMLTYGGPTGGDLNAVKKIDTIIASRDIVAADSYAASLFDIQPDELSYVKAGVEMGLGRSDLQNLKIEELTVSG
jgi:uncharacterized protein (DUF362 family)